MARKAILLTTYIRLLNTKIILGKSYVKLEKPDLVI